MAQRPLVVAFDVIETLFPLEPMRARLVQAGQPGAVLELWFARILRDAFALTAAGDYRRFAEVAASALVSVTKGALTNRVPRWRWSPPTAGTSMEHGTPASPPVGSAASRAGRRWCSGTADVSGADLVTVVTALLG